MLCVDVMKWTQSVVCVCPGLWQATVTFIAARSVVCTTKLKSYPCVDFLAMRDSRAPAGVWPHHQCCTVAWWKPVACLGFHFRFWGFGKVYKNSVILCIKLNRGSRDSSGFMVTNLRAGRSTNRGSTACRDLFISSPKCPYRLWVLPSHQYCTGGAFPGNKANESIKLITHLHVMPKLRMCGAIPPIPYMPS
jgi:hypothetical protein